MRNQTFLETLSLDLSDTIDLDSLDFDFMAATVGCLALSDELKFESIQVPAIEDREKLKCNQKGIKTLLAAGGKFVDALVYLQLGEEQKKKCRLVRPVPSENVDISKYVYNMHILLLAYLIADIGSFNSETHVPALIKRLSTESPADLQDAITSLVDLKPILKRAAQSLDFSKYDSGIRSRMALGIAGHRFVNIFVENFEVNQFSGSAERLYNFCYRLHKSKPLRLLHPAFKSNEIQACGSLNRLIAHAIIEHAGVTEDEFREKYLKDLPFKHRRMEEIEFVNCLDQWLKLETKLIESSLKTILLA